VLGLPVLTESVDTGSAVLPRGEAGIARPAPAAQDVSDLRRTYRRRRVARRARIAWTDANFGRLAVSGAAMVVLILAWLVLRRVLR